MACARVSWCLLGTEALALILHLTVIRMAESQLEVCLHVSTVSRKKGAMGDCIPDVLQSLTSSPSSSSVVQVGTLPKLLDQWRSITSNRFVLYTVKGHHLCLGAAFHHSVFSDGLT